MTELTPEARRLLAQLRSVDDPTARERASGDAAVRGMLKANGVVGLPPLVTEFAASKAAVATRASGTLRTRPADGVMAKAVPGSAGAKLGWSVVAGLVVALGLYAAQSLRAPERAPRLLAPAQPVNAPERGALDQPASAATEPALAAAISMQREEPHGGAALGSKAHARRGATKPALSSLSEELKFVASVDAELRSGSYDRVLQRLAQHKGTPALAEERAALRVLALCGRDNDAAAAQARDHFLRGAPSSVLAARVRAACRAGLRP